MSEQPSTEVPVARELLEKMLAAGSETKQFFVERGPDPEARIVGVRLEGQEIVLEYDRPVEVPLLTHRWQEPRTDEIPLKDVRRLALKPGDVLVVRVEGVLTPQQAEAVMARIEEFIPGYKVMVLAPGTELEVLETGRQPVES